MLYLLNIDFEKPHFVPKKDLYYGILGGFLTIFQDQTAIYDSIIKLSFSIKDIFTLHLTVQGEKNYNMIVNELLQKKNEKISIQNNTFTLNQLRFNFQIFDEKNIKIFPIPQRTLSFQSPTKTKSKNINYLLPEPERFLFSAFQKLQDLFSRDVDTKAFKTWLKYNIFVGEFHLRTEQIIIKKAKHSGVVGYCKYYCKDLESDYYTYLCITLQAMKFVGIGSGVKLGLGNVGVKW